MAGLAILPIPILSVPAMIATMPILLILDDIAPTFIDALNLQITGGMLNLVLESVSAWVFFGVTLFCLGLALGFARCILTRKNVSNNIMLAVMLAIYFGPLILMVVIDQL